ncbi:multifunctional transcriptional regulator/nicotinamide-nucleotide adenylyltransferase/ribosylnicotinamide kinase NadR [secondary endosymbiont of Ctenarytaina eucalypti]|uniref:Nicotinamide-nucleotide adenylyltransferase, NadR type n=1 Tax=secondary endosymbiont of Ctenarytaina eucalypti TaxID=1199245 RepID=J3YSB0_9ENTR|nr:multifunctional transcriptional regulator/nicotinamide-nucleotide adenylyltransferase/ribosylnicotinamide kinase NadR [secondary endosymbiont of Ctenarytaina eucalypti]AFP85103.1 nicotinamide-nucleotide adenylyltransferase, NadR type [secondary endosymbiont of Ctenarytaina eucalypti]
MSSFNYLNSAINKHKCILKKMTGAYGFTNRPLIQLVTENIQNQSTQQPVAINNFLGIKFPPKQKKIGMIFGKFYPLHTGHIYLIQRACGQVDELNVILNYNDQRDLRLFENSAMSKQPTLSDRLRWLLQTFKYQKNIRIHAFNEQGIDPHPHGWAIWSQRVKSFLVEKGIEANVIYSSRQQELVNYREHLGLKTVIIDPDRLFIPISGEKIRHNPYRYWKYIPAAVKPFFVRTVALIGGESSGKSTIVSKLASLFNTTSAWEYGRHYVFTYLGGDNMALQYSDYDKIALGHAHCIDRAVKCANKVTFIDTDFVTSQVFCKKYHGREHPFVQAMIDEYRFDLVILMKNNTPWVADGLRSLGTPRDRDEFQRLLEALLHENHIPYVRVDVPDYDQRFLKCIMLVQELLGEQLTVVQETLCRHSPDS